MNLYVLRLIQRPTTPRYLIGPASQPRSASTTFSFKDPKEVSLGKVRDVKECQPVLISN